MLKPIAIAAATFVLAVQGQNGAAPPADLTATTATSDAPSATTSSAASPAFTGTIATLDLPGASSSSSSSAGPAKPVVVPPDRKALRRLTDAVVTYVRNQRGWMDGTYKVYFYGYDDGLTVMAVDLTQGDNAYNFVSAEGQPFKVEIDPATYQVKRERY